VRKRRRADIEVQVVHSRSPWGLIEHIKISCEKENLTWDELQAIKNEVVGEDAQAIEIYPAASDVVFEVPMRHLWVVPPDIELPSLRR